MSFWKIVLKRKGPLVKKRENDIPDLYLDTVYFSENKPLSLLLLKAINKPGIIFKVTEIIAGKGKNIIKLNVPDIAFGDYGFVLILVDNCDESCGEDLKKEIMNRLGNDIIKIDVITSTNSYIFLKYNRLLLLGDESIVITKKMIERAIYYVYKKGMFNAVAFLTDFGRGIGESIYDIFISELMKDVERKYEERLRDSLKMFTYIYKALGLGDMLIEGLEELGNSYRIIIRNNYECTALAKYGSKHGFVGKVGNMTKGVIEGFFRKLFNREVSVKEIECVLEGRQADLFTVDLREYAFEL